MTTVKIGMIKQSGKIMLMRNADGGLHILTSIEDRGKDGSTETFEMPMYLTRLEAALLAQSLNLLLSSPVDLLLSPVE